VFVALVGWGRRVPVQPNRISTPVKHVIHELGGPVANLVVAIVLGFAWQLLSRIGMASSLELSPALLGAALYVIVFLNLSMFAFQLLPIPGLDGWGVIEAIFRNRNARFFYNVNSRRQQIWVGCIVVIFLFQLFQGASLLSIVMTPFYLPASLISLGGCAGYAIPGFVGLHPCQL
jgi:Zn-dependent protease